MKKLVLSIAASALALSMAPAAHALITFDADPGNSLRSSTFAWQSSLSGSYTLDSTDGVSGIRARPFNTTGEWFAVGGSNGQPAYFDLTDVGSVISSFSFVWGSIDNNPPSAFTNILQVLGAGKDGDVLATITGGDVAAFLAAQGNGDQTDPNTNPTVRLLFSGADQTNAKWLKFYDDPSSGHAFEVLPLAAAVPEPSTWAMMILGIGFAGLALRRRRQTVSVKYA